MSKPIFLIAESGRPKEILEAWRERFLEAERGLRAYMDEIGADGAFRFSAFEKPGAFRFPGGAVPEGWTKPSRRGASRPKKSNAEAIRRLEEMLWCESLDDLVPEALGLPTGVAYASAERSGFTHLASERITAYSACWTADVDGTPADVILVAPDFAAFQANLEGELTWKPEGTRPEIPKGFRQVSEAEVDLIFAQAKVAREKRDAAETEAPDLSA